MTSRTEFPGIPPAPGMAILPVTAEEVSVSGPRAPGTAGTDIPYKNTKSISYSSYLENYRTTLDIM